MEREAFYVVVSAGDEIPLSRLLAAAVRADLPLPELAPTAWPLALGGITVEAVAATDAPRPGAGAPPPELAERLGAARTAYLLRFEPGLSGVAEALTLARLLLDEASGAVLDLGTGRLLDREQLDEITASDGFEVRDHVVLHAVAEPGAEAWVHTHGMAKLGVPDLEAFEVPPDSVGEVAQLFNDLCTDLAFGEGPEPGETIELPGGSVVLRPSSEVRSETAGLSFTDLREHRGPYLALQAQAGELEACVEGYGSVELKSDEEVEVERASTQVLLPRFVARATRRHDGEEFYVKAPFPVNGPAGETREHMWVELEEVEGGVIEGPLAAASYFEPQRWPEGTRVSVLLAEVEAVAAIRDGEVVSDDDLESFLSERS